MAKQAKEKPRNDYSALIKEICLDDVPETVTEWKTKNECKVTLYLEKVLIVLCSDTAIDDLANKDPEKLARTGKILAGLFSAGSGDASGDMSEFFNMLNGE